MRFDKLTTKFQQAFSDAQSAAVGNALTRRAVASMTMTAWLRIKAATTRRDMSSALGNDSGQAKRRRKRRRSSIRPSPPGDACLSGNH